nr:uncharacterized protein LOC129270190 [Lytechinus pictus]
MLVHEKDICSRDPLGLDVSSMSQGLHPISPVAISITTSNGFQTPPAPQHPSGKPLAMLLQSMEDTEEEKPTSSAQTTNYPETPLTPQPRPEPVPSPSSVPSSRPAPASSPSSVPSSRPATSSIAPESVEKRVQRFYSRGKLIRQKELTRNISSACACFVGPTAGLPPPTPEVILEDYIPGALMF